MPEEITVDSIDIKDEWNGHAYADVVYSDGATFELKGKSGTTFQEFSDIAATFYIGPVEEEEE